MTVEELAKELAKIPNQQMPVFFKAEGVSLWMEGLAIPVNSLNTKSVLTLQGDRVAAILTGKPV